MAQKIIIIIQFEFKFKLYWAFNLVNGGSILNVALKIYLAFFKAIKHSIKAYKKVKLF